MAINEQPDFLKDIWSKRARGIELPEVDWGRPATREDVQFLLDHYPYLRLINTEAMMISQSDAKFIQVSSGWTVHDYGDALAASPGELLFGGGPWLPMPGEESDEEGGEGDKGLKPGKGTIVNQAFLTASEMIDIAIEKGWAGAEIIDGHRLMQWAAWVEAKERGFALDGFEPSEKEQEKRERVRKKVSEVSDQLRPKT